jgi:Concanavalin A-like lectin/glucanases superfamily/The GLUG motif
MQKAGLMILVLMVWLNVFAQNQVLTLDGDGDFVSFGTNLVGGRTDFTICAWIKAPSSYSNWDYSVLSEWESGGVPGLNNFIINFDSFVNSSGTSPHYPSFAVEQGSTISIVNSTSGVLAGNWYQIAVIKESDEIRILVNDVISTASCGTGAINNNSNNPLQIGNFGAGYYSELSIDELRIWDYVRTPAHIQNNMYGNLTGNEAGLLGYWNFENGTADDLTNNNNDGTLNGNPIISYEPIPGFSDSFSAGDGSEGNPFQISNLNDLFLLSSDTTNWSSYFIQTADIDASAASGWNAGTGFSPIGNDPVHFMGNYNGQGHTISNLNITKPYNDKLGLFGSVFNAEIINLGVINSNVWGWRNVGGIIGQSLSDSYITNCYSTGGLVRTSFQSCGGLVGYCNDTMITNCYSSCGIMPYLHDKEKAGGLIGSCENSTISKCHFTGLLEDTYYMKYCGGLVGISCQSTFTECYNTARVRAEKYCGGLAGCSQSSTFTNCYNTGTVVSRRGYNGGLVGWVSQSTSYPNATVINSSYNAGYIAGVHPKGGLIGYINGSVSVANSFWDTQISGVTTTYGGGTGKTTLEMKDYLTYYNAGWDFMDETVNGTDDDWGINSNENSGYPFLSWQGYSNILGIQPNGDGTSSDPYQITCLDNLLWLSDYETSWNSWFIQTADIDATDTQDWNNGAGFSPIGNSTVNFSGNYNGQGYNITELYINRPSANKVSLFGITSGAEINNLETINVTIIGNYNVGGLVGELNDYSAITNCYSSGIVNGNYNVGGLVGSNFIYSVISCCYSRGETNGISEVGGLVGSNDQYSEISNCFSAGFISGSGDNVGGLLGYNNNSSVDNSFWDTQTSGQSSSAGGTGKTTAEMKDYFTYYNAGWDFMDETVNGTDDNWGINSNENSRFPFLCWQGYIHAPVIFLDAPQNITIVTLGSTVSITWDMVVNATFYKVFSSSNSNTGFTEDTSGSFNGESWSSANSEDKKFYYVIAVN